MGWSDLRGAPWRSPSCPIAQCVSLLQLKPISKRSTIECGDVRVGFCASSVDLPNFGPALQRADTSGGESHRYLGRQYRLKIVRAPQNRVVLRAGRLVVETSNPGDHTRIRKLVRAWVRARANVVLRERFEATASIRAALGVRQPTLRIVAMKSRWGSFTKSGNILLNELLVTAPPECIDYVILHELCHAAVPNHSPRFFQLLRRFMPDWERRKELLERSTV